MGYLVKHKGTSPVHIILFYFVFPGIYLRINISVRNGKN
jgi:hypothetical protein